MKKAHEESQHVRTSAGTDGQELCPAPAANMRGPAANEEKGFWADIKDPHPADGSRTETTPPPQRRSKEEEIEQRKEGEENTEGIREDNPQELAEEQGDATQRLEHQEYENTRRRTKERERREIKKRKREQAMREQRKKLEDFDKIFSNEASWPRYLSLTTTGKTITALELDDHLLQVHATEELTFKSKHNDDYNWIIKTTSKEQSAKYLAIQEINGVNTSVKAHSEMNSIWGTMMLPSNE